MHRNLCGTYVEVVVNLNHGRVNTRAKAFDFKQAEHTVRAGSYNHETWKQVNLSDEPNNRERQKTSSKKKLNLITDIGILRP